MKHMANPEWTHIYKTNAFCQMCQEHNVQKKIVTFNK